MDRGGRFRPTAGRHALALGLLLLAAPCATPQSAETHLGKGYEALKLERYDVAAREFREALRSDPTLVMRARFPLAVALFELKQSSEARQEFEAVRREAGDHPNISYYLGRLDLLDRDFAKAVSNLKLAITKPPFPDTAYYLGLACFKDEDLACAEKWLKEAAAANPRDSLAPYELAQLYRKQGREAEARKALAQSAELRRRDTSESQLRRECAQKLDSAPRDEARALCQGLYDPDNAERLTALGTLYGQHGDFEAALEPLRRAAELTPQAPQMQYNLAFTYYRMGRYQEARLPVEKAVQRWPDIFQLNSLYGAILFKLDDNTAAYQALGKANRLNPDDVPTRELLYAAIIRLARQCQAGHQEEKARQYLAEAAQLRGK